MKTRIKTKANFNYSNWLLQLSIIALVMLNSSELFGQSVTQNVTYGDKSKLLELLPDKPEFTSTTNGNTTLTFDENTTFQTVEGFGYTLTQSSAYVLMTELSTQQRTDLLSEIFDPSASGIASAFVRIGIGATDLSQYPYTYNDLPEGQADEDQSEFSLAGPDLDYTIPVLQEILAINADIQIKAVPWTAPAWMKTNGALSDGSLKPEYYASYATYFVKYIQEMANLGIDIHYVVPQNEPHHAHNNPAMYMTAQEQINFILELGPAIQNAGFNTKILTWDHNCDEPEYPMEVLGSQAGQYVYGAAWHLYGGDISALSQVHDAFPSKHMFFTEQYTGASGSFEGDLGWHIKNVFIGGMNNWSKTGLQWNLANDANIGPHTDGGCTDCLGALTLDAGNVTRNVSYYNVGQFSKFIRPGAYRVSTTSSGSLHCAGFVNSSSFGNTKVMVVYNDGRRNTTFNISYNGKIATFTLPKKSVGTYVWSAGTAQNNPPTASFSYSATDLVVDLDGSGSSDSDGSISSYAWDLGDGNNATGQTTSHIYSASGNYTVVLTVTDNEGATDTESQVVSVTEGATGDPVSVHVQTMVTGTEDAGRGAKRGAVTITIHNDLEDIESGATVTGTFSGTFSETVSGITGGDGTVYLTTSATAKGGVTVDFCVDDVNSSLPYDAALNDITCTSNKNASITSVNNSPMVKKFIYPNPVNSSFNLHGNVEYLEIINASGQMIKSINSPEKTIDVSALTEGLYLVRLKENNRYYSELLIVK